MRLRRWIKHRFWYQPDTVSPPHKARHISRPLRNGCLKLKAHWHEHWKFWAGLLVAAAINIGGLAVAIATYLRCQP